MPEEVFTAFGTRAVLLVSGGMVTLTKDEHDTITLDVSYRGQEVQVALSQSEALTLIGNLAAAAQPGTGRPYVEASAEEVSPEALPSGQEP